MFPYSKTMADKETLYISTLYKKVPITVSVICGSGESASVAITTSNPADSSANWHLVSADDLTGWSNGVASQGAEPLGIYTPITGLRFIAAGTPTIELA